MQDLNTLDLVVPTEAETRIAEEAGRALAGHAGEELRMQLRDGQSVLLPGSVARLLSHVLTEMAEGNAVAMIPIHAEMTTQEAANFLNVSRPHLVSLLERGDIPFHKVGSHRRVKFQDVKSYRDRVRADRAGALDELARVSQDLGLGY